MTSRPERQRGQSLAELALVTPVLLLLIGGAVQYALIMETRHEIIQVARDTARWAATQTYDPCDDAASDTPRQPLTLADELATSASLIGYSAGDWNSGNFLVQTGALPASLPHKEGVEVLWTVVAPPPPATPGPCPPQDNTTQAFVTIRLTHAVPILFPGAWFIPGLCDGSGCDVSISATAMFRMEPPPE
ncbi:MAG: pilus assembly protein [Chloroflexi bacterium]|nr:pilus assembly protein [Chloroflexota bacterium]